MLKKLFCAIVLLNISSAVDIRDYEEGTGIIPPLANIDVDWLFSVKSWNFLYGSKYGFFRFAHSFKGKAMEELSESDLEEECITTKLSDKGIVSLHAFGKSLDYEMSFGEHPAIINWRIKDTFNVKDQTTGVSYAVLTDNKTFFATLQYWDHSRKGWFVMSTEKTLSPEVKAKVHEKIKPYGFNLDLAYYKDFTTCTSLKEEL